MHDLYHFGLKGAFMYRLYNILGSAGIDSVSVSPNPSSSEGKEYLFEYHCTKPISTAQKDEAKGVLDTLIASLEVSDPEGILTEVQAERDSITD